MPVQIDYLITLAQGPTILTHAAALRGCAECTLRVVAILSSPACKDRQCTVADIGMLLGVSYQSASAAVKEGRELGWLNGRYARHQRVQLSLDGWAVVTGLKRGEREARVRVQTAGFPKWPRRYTKSVNQVPGV